MAKQNTKNRLKFSDRAEDYAKYRTNYSDEVFNRILQEMGNLANLQAVDVGAGTGIASRQLANRGLQVIAVEPDQRMIQAAEPHPRVKFQTGPAESIKLSDSVADLVTIFQAFHWFKFRVSLQEFRRILKPAGRLAIVWYALDSADPFSKRCIDLIWSTINKATDATIHPSSTESTHQSETSSSSQSLIKQLGQLRQRVRKLAPSRLDLLKQRCWIPGFKDVRRYDLIHQQSVDLPALIGLARSHSGMPLEGPLWQKLVADLERLVDEPNIAHTLVYKVTIYLGTSRKR